MSWLPFRSTVHTRPASRRRRWLIVSSAVVGSVALLVLLSVGYALVLMPDVPSLREIRNPEIGLATTIYAADGEELGQLYREHRVWVGHDAIAPAVLDALIATEDHRFYGHHGIDVRRTISSAWRTLRGNRQGASTITMQLARNLFPALKEAEPAERKVKEMMTALKIEQQYSKREILEMYLNTVPFGHNAFGIEAAAQTYFGTTARGLDVAEAATLIGMLKGTTRYNPRRYPERAWQRRNVVLGQMVKRGRLDADTFEQLMQEPIALRFQRPSRADGLAPHFVEHVRAWLEDWAAAQQIDPYASGLRVYTTLDADLQRLAQAAVDEQMRGLQAVAGYEWSRAGRTLLAGDPAPYLRAEAAEQFEPFGHLWRTERALVDEYIRQSMAYRRALRTGRDADRVLADLRADAAFMDSLKAVKTRLEAGFVALDPQTGHVKAWVGGRDFAQDQYDKVALARRQPGSTFKPFVYAAAIDLGYSPYHMFRDSVVTYQSGKGNEVWRPLNAGGWGTGDTLTLRDALAYSKNTITAQVMAEIGPYQVARVAQRLGITSPLDRVPSLALGTSEVSLLELTSAYATLAAHGQRRTPLLVTRIENRNGTVLASFASQPKKVFSKYTSYTVLDMLRGVIDRGTGRDLRTQFGIEADVAGKTGTTQNSADGWFMLMHPRLVMGAWVGFNDRRVTFRSSHWGQGAHNALRLVGDFMQRATADTTAYLPDEAFRPPHGWRAPRPYDAPGALYAEPLDESPRPYMRDAVAEGLGVSTDTVRRRIIYRPDGTRRIEEARPEQSAEAQLREQMPLAPLSPQPSRPTAPPEDDAETILRRAVQPPDTLRH